MKKPGEGAERGVGPVISAAELPSEKMMGWVEGAGAAGVKALRPLLGGPPSHPFYRGEHMKYTSAAAFRQALEQRLKNRAASTGLGLARLRKRVACELFLRRLLIVAPDRWCSRVHSH
jgi:hypothetical protein